MEIIIIFKNKVFFKWWSMDEGKAKIVEIAPENLINYLWMELRIVKGTSLKHIFEIIEPQLNLWETILNEDIKPLFKEIQKDPFDPIKPDQLYKNESFLKYLEVYWDVDYSELEKELSIWPSFHGIGIDTDSINYALDFTPVCNIRNIEVILNKTFKIIGWPPKVPGDKIKEWTFGTKSFILLEVFKAIFWELTFMGSPKERDNKYEEIVDSCKKEKKNA